MDARVGKYNGNPPTQTVCGNEASRPFLMTIGIGNGYYVVRDVFPCPNWQDVVSLLRKSVAVGVKRGKRESKKLS